MSNVNTTAGFFNLPAQAITVNTITALAVPAQGAFGSGLPSPLLLAGNGLSIGFPPDIAGSVYDCHPFTVTVAGKFTTAGSYTVLPSLYQVPGTVVAAKTQGTLTNDAAVFLGAATSSGAAGTQNFLIQVQFLWDSTTGKLTGGVQTYQINGVNIATLTPGGTAGQLQPTTVVSSVGVNDLNFIPSFTFGTAGANSVTVTEFSIDR